ncbi:hypothetical protein LJC40_06140 [Synergistaceae bacterium OttesenSCG-928-D05]|nr:hypothetical protein [Synergistaceae bacterium OttesenSCG-928-D05]
MKKVIFAIIFLIVLSAGSANAALPQSPTGFGGLKWGDSHKKLGSECVLVDKELDYGTVYSRRDEKLEVDGVQLQGITYSFYHDKFLNVAFEFAGKKDFNKLKVIALEKYGPGHMKKTGNMESYRWDDEHVFIILDFIPQTSEGQLLITYVPILEEVVQEIEKRRANVRPATPGF